MLAPIEQLYKCKHCPATFPSTKSIAAHMRVHKPNFTPKVVKEPPIKHEVPITVEETLQQWICSICNTEFASLKSLK